MSPAKGVPSAIPVGTQFSPALFDLHEFAKAVVAHGGDKQGLETAVWQSGVRIASPKRKPTRRMKSLPIEAAVDYGLIDRETCRATELAKKLAGLQPHKIYEEFARHILLNCGGLRVLDGIQQMQADGMKITGDALAAYLTSQGFPVTVHNTAINTMRMWLAKAGLFPAEGKTDLWKLDRSAKEKLLGQTDETISILSDLNAEQLAFLRALCSINPHGWYFASEVRNLAEATSGLQLRRGSLPKEYLQPLAVAGLIEYESGGTASGKSARLRTTPTFNSEVLQPFVENAVKDLDSAVAAFYTKPPKEIYAELESKDTFVKGRALEAYAIHLMRLLHLRFLAWRARGHPATAWAEVDAVFAGVVGNVPTRWQVQCKNTPKSRVDLEDVAKEVGLLPVTQATHVLIIANCNFTDPAKNYAMEVMNHTPVTIFLLDRKDFEAVKRSPGALGSILAREAEIMVRNRPLGTLFASRK